MTATDIPKTTRRSSRTTITKAVRVAVYARQSVERVDGGDFGSIEAQVEAIQAYVTSQASLGWVAIDEPYIDRNISGATTNRPAFQRMLADVEAGRVDVLACYKTDRLSRSLLDFGRLIEFLDARDVSFVSVTQSFDTSTPIGRLTLNMVMSFAEFERETTAERIRDKTRASKRRGIWTGGFLPLGYDTQNKKLVVNEAEAERVRAIFQMYLDSTGYMSVLDELQARGWMNKAWTTKRGTPTGGKIFSKNSLSKLLMNPIYLGLIHVEGEVVEGEHDATVPRDLWDAVQAKLAKSRNGAVIKPRSPAMLAGLLRCARCGKAMSRTWSSKNGKRYEYYTCGTVVERGAKACPGGRVTLTTIEDKLIAQVRVMGSNPDLVRATIEAARADHEQRRPGHEEAVLQLGDERRPLVEERTNIMTAIGQGNAPPSLTDRLAELDVAIADIEERLADTHAALQRADAASLDEDDLRTALSSFNGIWDVLWPEERQRIVHLIVESATYDARTEALDIEINDAGVRLLSSELAT